MAATDIAFFTERLILKEQELGELKSAFHTYKLKQKVKYDNLKKDVYAFCRTTGQSEEEKDNVALMQIKVAELETELEEAKRTSEGMVEELSKRQTQLNDHMILIKSLETRLKEMSPEDRTDKKSQNIDMERVQQQMLYKDQRIIELNNSILEKERQILDLQEMCREQGEVADVKKQAMKIVQKKFEEMESRGKREIGTETDPWFPPRQRDIDRGQRAGGASRSLSPGHAIVSRAAGGSSPPPLDPQFDSEAAGRLDEVDMAPGTSSGFHGKNLDEEVTLRKKERKRVTFDLPPSGTGTPTLNSAADNNAILDQLNATIARLTEENSRLMADLDNTNMALINSQKLLDENEKEISRLLRDTKNSSLKARAVAHSRIRELEETLAGLNEEHMAQSSRFTTEIETLRSTREWEIEQNGLLRDQIDKLRDKNAKLTAEVDATGVLNIDLEKKIDEMRNLIEGVSGELDEAEELVVFLEDQKESMLDDVEKMKEALFAQDEYIKLLETDNVIYEEHIGILRDSLGASKVDHRSLLRSKAFETKLKALEQEKEQISIKSREEKLKTKALAQKVKILEEENEKLMERLCEKEMGAADDADMSETCRQLEARLRDSDQQMNYLRTQFEIELEAVRMEHKQRQTECEDLKYRLFSLENRNAEQHHVGAAGPSHQQQQTQLALADNSQEVQELRNQVQEGEAKIRELVQSISTLESELDTVRVTNFELQDRLKETEEIETDYDQLIERHRTTCTELVSLKDAFEKFRAEKEKDQDRADVAEKEITRLRMELDGTRNTYNENVAIKKELEEIKTELEQERAVVQQKWEDVCRKAFETPSEPGSRKSSMEIQNQQYMIAFEDKIGKLEEDLFEMTSKLAESEIEKQDLRRQLERIQEVNHVRLVNEEEQAQKLMVENDHLEMAVELEKKTEENLLAKISDLELEASLAGELSVEMGRVIQHMEKQMQEQKVEIAEAGERAHSAQMELRLHEMLNEELGSQLDDLKEREKVWMAQQEENGLEAGKHSARIEELDQALASQTKQNQLLVQQIQELESRLTVSVTETKDVRTELQESRDEVREVQGELQDAQMAEVQRRVNSQEHFQEPAVYQTQKEYQQAYAQWYYSQAGQTQRQTGGQASQTETQYPSGQYRVNYPPTGAIPDPQQTLTEIQYPVNQQTVPQSLYSQTQRQYPVQQPETSHNHGSQTVPQSHGNQLQYPVQTTETSHTHVHDHQACTSHYDYQTVPSPDQSTGHDHQICTSHVHVAAVHPTLPDSQVKQGQSDSLEQVQNENELLRQCVNETIQLREDMSQDVEKLLELKNELEIAVNSLKGEIWTLNGQLKASILDRENLEDRVVSLDTSLMEEKKKVSALDVELSEHQELIEKATRQAAESENESNRRLAECLEMETRRIELEEAYSQLTEYYNQLQAAYNLLYAQQQQGVVSGEVQQSSQAVDPSVVGAIDLILAELSLPVEGDDIRAKLNAIQEKIRQKIEEVEHLQTAVSEQSRVARALEDRLEAVEEDRNVSGGQQLELRSRVEQLEGDLEWKQEECDSLRRQVDELQHSLNTIIVNDGDDSLATSRLRTELAILAARLATRQADVDSLFRTNAELAHTNVRLQNELDEKEDETQEQEGVEGQQALAARVQELERKLADWTDSKEEIKRLKGIEKVLNNRILSLEEQLLEKEEQLQEMEEQVMESGSQDKIQTLEAANEAVIMELEELRQERNALRVSIQTKEKDQSREKEQAQEEVRAYQGELEEMKTELEALKAQVAESEEKMKLETVKPTQSEWEDWGEKTEEDGLKEELTALRAELARAQEEQKEKENLFEEELEILKKELEESQSEKKKLEAQRQKEENFEGWEEPVRQQLELLRKCEKQESQKEDNWGEWDDKTDQSQELERLKERLEAVQNEQEELKLRNMELEEELKQREGQRDESHSQRTSLERELNTVRRELEELKKLESQKTQEDNWGEWDEKPDQNQEVQRLETALEAAQNSQEELKLRNMELEEELTAILKQRAGQGEDRTSLERELESVRTELEALRMRDTSQGETEDVEELKLNLEEALQSCEEQKLRNMELEEQVKTLSVARQTPDKNWESEEKSQIDEAWGDWEEKEKDDSELTETLTELNAALKDQVKKLTEEEWNLKEASRIEEERLGQEIGRLQQQLIEVQSQGEDLSLRNMELEEELRILKEKKQESWGEWDEKPVESGDLRIRLTELEERLTDYDELTEEAQRVRERLEETERQLAERTRELESIQKPKTEENWSESWGEDSPDGIDQLKKELEATNRERTMMEAVISRVERENEDLMGQLEEAGVVEREMNRQVESTRIALTELQQEVQLLREEKSRLEVETTQNVKSEDAWGDDWEGKEDLSQKQKEELEECQNKLATVSTTLQSVEQTLRVTQESAQQRQIELEEKIQTLETELDRAQSGSEEQMEKEQRLKTVEARLTEMEKQNSLLKESESRLLESVDEWGAIADKNQEEVDRLQKVVNSLEAERHSLLEEVQLLKTEIGRLKASQPEVDNSDLQNHLQVLKTERDSLKEQLAAMSVKLTEVEKEKNQVKTAYEQLKAKIQARRAAQAAGSSNTPSRAPSRASVASVGEIREDPTELAYQVSAQSVHVQAPQTNYSQAVDARVQEFLEDVKNFLSRLDTISLNSLEAFNEAELVIDLMGKQKTRSVCRADAAGQQTSSVNSIERLEQKLTELIEQNAILEDKLRSAEGRLERTCQVGNSLKLSDEEVLRLHDEIERLKTVEKEYQDLNKILSVNLEAAAYDQNELQCQLEKSVTVTQNLRSELEVLRMGLQLKETQTACQQEKLEVLTEELRQTRTELELQTARLVQREEADLQKSSDKLTESLGQESIRDELQCQLDQSLAVTESLRTELEVLRMDLELKETETVCQQKKFEALTEELRQTRTELELQTIQREEDDLQKQSCDRGETLGQENDDLKTENSRLTEDLTALGAEVDQLEAKILEMEQENKILARENTQLRKEQTLLTDYQEQLDRVLSEKEGLISRKESELETATRDLEKERQRTWSLEEERDSTQKDLEMVKKELQAVLSREQDQEELLSRLQSVEDRSSGHLDRIEDLEALSIGSERHEQTEDREQSLEKEKNQLQTENSQLSKDLATLGLAVDQLESKMLDMERENKSLCQEKEEIIKDVQRERDSALNQLEVVKEELELARSRVTDAELDTVTLEKVQRERDSVLSQLEVVKRRDNELEQLLIQRLEDIETRAGLHAEKIDQLAGQDSKLESLLQENERLSSLLVNYDSERSSMREALSGLHAELGQAVSHVQKVEESLEELDAVKGHNKELRETVDQYQREIESLRTDLQRVRSVELNQEELASAIEELEAVKKPNKRLTETVDQYLAEIDSLRRELETVKDRELDLEELTNRLEELQTLLEQKTEVARTLESQNQTLLSEAATIQGKREEDGQRLDNLSLSLSAAEDALKWKEVELENLTEENERLEKELDRAVASRNEKETEVWKLTEDLNSLEAELDMLAAKMLMMEQERRQIQNEKIQQSSVKEDSAEEVTDLRQRIEEKNREISILKDLVQKEKQQDLMQLQHVSAKKVALELERDGLIQKMAQLEAQLSSEQERSLNQLEQLRDQLSFMESEKDSLAEELHETTEELKKSHQTLTERLRDDLQRMTDDRERLRDEFEQCQVALELSRVSEESSSAKIHQLEMRLTELEAEKGQAQKLLTETNDSLQAEVTEWRTKFKQAYSDLCQLHPALQHAQTSVGQLLAQNAELHQQVVTLGQEKEFLLSRPQEQVEDSPAVLQLEPTMESTPPPLVSTASETRISIEDTVTESEDESSSDTRLLLPTFDDVIDRVSSSSFVRAGAPITQPLLRRLRAIWGRRAVRPYLRYCVAVYFVFLHFMLFNCWFHF